MKYLISLVLCFMFVSSFVGSVFAEKNITITLSDEEYDCMEVILIRNTPEEWIQHAASNKARKSIDKMIETFTDKNYRKLDKAEKEQEIKDIGKTKLNAEKAKRRNQ